MNASEAFHTTIAANPLGDDHRKMVTDAISEAISKGWLETRIRFPEIPTIVQRQIIDWLRSEGYTIDLTMVEKGRTVFSVGWGDTPIPQKRSCEIRG